MPKAELFSRSFTSSHKAAFRNEDSTRSSISEPLLTWPAILGPYATLSYIDFGKGFGFWKTIPILRLTSTGSTALSYKSTPLYLRSPVTRAVGMRSFMRLKLRNMVVFPQPEGPMKAVISLVAISIFTSLTALKSA